MATLRPMPRDASLQPSHQRAHGRAELGVVAAPGGARLKHLYQAAPSRILFPDTDPGDPTLGALVNVAGGLAGGDRIELSLRLEEGARFTATTPAAEKVYRSLGPATEIHTEIAVASGATCEWLPQETILFDGARLRRRIDIALDPEARLLAAEMLVLGRAAHGESYRRGAVLDAWRIRRGGRLLWADALRLDDPEAAGQGRFLLAGANAVATLLLAAPDAAAQRERARELSNGSASLVAPGLLLTRWIGEAGAVRAALCGALPVLRAEALGHPARLPRLWRS